MSKKWIETHLESLNCFLLYSIVPIKLWQWSFVCQGWVGLCNQLVNYLDMAPETGDLQDMSKTGGSLMQK